MPKSSKIHKKLVEIGRVAYAAKGPKKGKLCAIIDVIDYNRVLVDGPEQGSRREEKLKNLSLTRYKIKIQHSQRTKLIKKAWEDAQITQKFEKSAWAKTFDRREKKKNWSDFDRAKVFHLKLAKNKAYKMALKINRTRKILLKQRKRVVASQLLELKRAYKNPQKPVPMKVSRLFARLRTKGYLKEKEEKMNQLKKERMEKLKKERLECRKAKAEAAKKAGLKKKSTSAKKRDSKKPAPKKLAIQKKDPMKAKQGAKPAVKKLSASKSKKTK